MKALRDFDVLKDWIWEQICELYPDDDEVGRQQELERYPSHLVCPYFRTDERKTLLFPQQHIVLQVMSWD